MFALPISLGHSSPFLLHEVRDDHPLSGGEEDDWESRCILQRVHEMSTAFVFAFDWRMIVLNDALAQTNKIR